MEIFTLQVYSLDKCGFFFFFFLMGKYRETEGDEKRKMQLESNTAIAFGLKIN